MTVTYPRVNTGVRAVGEATTSISKVWPESPPLRTAVKRPSSEPNSGQRSGPASSASVVSAEGSATGR